MNEGVKKLSTITPSIAIVDGFIESQSSARTNVNFSFTDGEKTIAFGSFSYQSDFTPQIIESLEYLDSFEISIVGCKQYRLEDLFNYCAENPHNYFYYDSLHKILEIGAYKCKPTPLIEDSRIEMIEDRYDGFMAWFYDALGGYLNVYSH